MKIVVPGGTGQIGTAIARSLHAGGHEIVVLGRSAGTTDGSTVPWRTVRWDGISRGEWCEELEGADVVVHLSGRSVNCRSTRANRTAILNSRVDSTRVLGHALAACQQPPPVWLQMSTATIYAHRYDAANDESTGILGGGEPDAPEKWRFSIEVVKAWEAECERAHTPSTRKVLLRTSMFMSPDRGGVFDALLGLVRRGLGGRAGDGQQYVSWIHESDFVRALLWLIEHDEVHGPVNLTAPHPLPYSEFLGILREEWGTRIALPAPAWLLEIGMFLLRSETELVLKSRRVEPRVLLQNGFEFQYSDWRDAVRDLVRRYRETSS